MKPVGIPLIRGMQVVRETPVLRCLRRRYPRHAQDLVSYYNVLNGRTSIGIWRNRIAGYVHEITSYGPGDPFLSKALWFVGYWLSGRRQRDRRSVQREVGGRGRSAMQRKLDVARDHADRMQSYLRTKTIHKRDNPAYKLIQPGTLNWR